MASQFKIPKKKLSSDSDYAHTHLPSPLSRLHGPAPQDYLAQSGRRGADRVHAGNEAGWSTDRRRDQVKTPLWSNSPDRGGASAPNHRAPGSWRNQPQPGQKERASAPTSNGWRPKRASDRLLGDERPSPPLKKSVDSSELQGEVHAGSLGGRTRLSLTQNHDSSEDDFLSPTRPFVHRPPVSWRRSLDRTAWTSTSTGTKEDGGREDRDRKSDPHPQLKKQTPAEPIVLSSEEDEEKDVMTSQSSSRREESRPRLAPQTPACRPKEGHDKPSLPFLQLEFSSLHAGLTHAHAHGKMMVRPCILVMDSLKLTDHEDVCTLIRGYLQVEWDARRSTRRLFSRDSMRSSSCRVPRQDNSSDCGVFLLQYVHSFLQNPVVHFDLPLRLDSWFPQQQVRQKREEIRGVILRLSQSAHCKN